MMRRRVALIVDHPQRDLPGIALLALELCRRGVVCHLVPLNSQERELWSLAPDFVLLNFTRRGTERLAQQLLETGIDFGLLDTEGAVYASEIGPDGDLRPRFENYTELLWRDVSLLKRASVACMWGPRLAEHLASGGWFAPEQLTLTGCPRFDFYHPRWRPVFDLLPAGEPGTPPRILINTWYPVVNSRLVSVSSNERQLRDDLGWSEEEIRRYFDAERGAILAFIDLTRRLSHDYPDAEIVLRPHPFESAEVYRAALATLANVRVDGTGPVYPQIFRASVLVARSCTTAVEAAMIGLPSLSPQWVPTPNVSLISEAASIPCENYESLRSRIDDILDRRYRRPPELEREVGKVVEDWFYRSDGLAHRRVSEAILGRLAGPRRVNEELCARFLREHEVAQRRRRGLRGKVQRLFGLPTDWSFRKMRVVPSPARAVKQFGVSDIQQLVARLNAALRRQGDTPVEPEVRPSDDTGTGHEDAAARSLTMACSAVRPVEEVRAAGGRSHVNRTSPPSM
jgi:surface carbohydrate biosynthesis protein